MPMLNIESIIRQRAEDRMSWGFLKHQSITQGYFAGGGLLRESARDIDLFPKTEKTFQVEHQDCRVCQTANASTYRWEGVTIQLCNYWHPSLKELVESFDFAHIKAGVRFYRSGNVNKIKEVYVSPDFLEAHQADTSFYTGSAYPLSSLVRLVKYAKRDVFPGKGYMPVLFDILKDVLNRGFVDYADFKDQLDAVDLGYLENDLNRECLMSIFEALRKDK